MVAALLRFRKLAWLNICLLSLLGLGYFVPVEAFNKAPCKACYRTRRFGDTCDWGSCSLSNDEEEGRGHVYCQSTGCTEYCTPYKTCKKFSLGRNRFFFVTSVTCKCGKPQPPCFPASATLRRLIPGSTNKWEIVPMPQVRIGDTVECLVREPVFHPDGSVTSNAKSGEMTRCQVYDYKKAIPDIMANYTTLTFKRPGSNTRGAITMTPNHHLLNGRTGLATHASTMITGDTLVTIAGDEHRTEIATVLGVSHGTEQGAYVPLLTHGGLLVVDGVVVYPSSGKCHEGLDAKHWGQYYLSAPVWQSLGKAGKNDGRYGMTLKELGSQDEGVGAYTRKFYAVAEAAAEEGRDITDWAGVAEEMHDAIEKEGKVYTEKEALAVYDRHISKATLVTA